MSKDSSENLPENAHKVPENTRQTSEGTRQTSEDTRPISEDAPEIIGREADILDFLWEGPKTTKEIAKHLALHESSARKHLKPLRVQGKIVAIHQGYYRLSEELAPWTELKNQKIIDSLMKVYAKSLEQHLQKEDVSLDDLKDLILMVDRLMKRWYLVHRGYDANTRQAQEDAKKKTVDREKQALENAPLEDRVVVVREYNESMRDILENLPEPIQKKNKV